MESQSALIFNENKLEINYRVAGYNYSDIPHLSNTYGCTMLTLILLTSTLTVLQAACASHPI